MMNAWSWNNEEHLASSVERHPVKISDVVGTGGEEEEERRRRRRRGGQIMSDSYDFFLLYVILAMLHTYLN